MASKNDEVMGKEQLDKWREEMNKMEINDLIKVKFLDSAKKWHLMFTPYGSDNKSFYCNLCKMVLVGGGKSVKVHCGLNKHKTSLETKIYDLSHESLQWLKSSSNKENQKSDNNTKSAKTNFSEDEFKSKLPTLTLEDFLKIEYKMNGTWKKFLIPVKSGYTCTICKSNLLTSTFGIRNHISNRQHKSNMEIVQGLFHPTLHPIKDLKVIESSNSSNEESTTESAQEKNKEKETIQDVQLIEKVETVNPSKINPIPVSIKSVEKKKSEESNVTVESSKTKNTNTENNRSKREQNDGIKKVETVKQKEPEVQVIESNGETSTDKPTKAKQMTVEDFIQEMISMDKKDILKVEYEDHEKRWKNLITYDAYFYYCQLCNISHLKEIPLYDHIKGRRHRDRVVAMVLRFYHPDISEPKNDSNEKPQNAEPLNAKNQQDKVNGNTSKSNQRNLRDSDVVLLNNSTEIVTVEDSPERELQPPGTENTTKNLVLNPAAIVGNQTLDSSKSSNQEKIKESQKDISETNKSNDSAKLHEKNDPKPQRQDKKRIETVQSGTNSKSKETATKAPDIDGFVGIEYVIQIIKHATDNDPRFECCLCEVETNTTGMQNHLKKLTHRLKYLERHYPTCLKQFREYRSAPYVMHKITEKICKAIEKYHGRGIPFECVQNDYRNNRRDYMEKVFSFRHASETSGPSFTNIVNKSELHEYTKRKDCQIPEVYETTVTFTKQNNFRTGNYPFTTEPDNRKQRNISPKKGRSMQHSNHPGQMFSPMPPNQFSSNYNPMYDNMMPNNMIGFEPMPMQNYQQPYNAGFYPEMQVVQNAPYQMEKEKLLDNEEHRRLAEKFIKNTKMDDKYDRRHRHSSRSPRRHSRRSRSRSRSRPRRSARSASKSPLRENDFWQAYRRKFDLDVKYIDMDFKKYHKDPQSFPRYNEEWQTFWANRVNELKIAGIEHHNYDFTHEWSQYFPKRLEELYEKEIEALKIRLRERFVLPMHNHELADPKYHIKNIFETRANANLSSKTSSQPQLDNQMSSSRERSPGKRKSLPESSPHRRHHREISPKPVLESSFSSTRQQDRSMKNVDHNNYAVQSPFAPKIRDAPVERQRVPSPKSTPLTNTSLKRRSQERVNKEFEDIDSDSNDDNIPSKKKKNIPKSPSAAKNSDLDEEFEEDTVTAMSVLRVLTALEDHLGTSLGPKIIDLMSKALALEKTKPTAVDEHLLTVENCLLLETCREKLKGQILAGLYKNQQLRAVKNVIKNITSLTLKASEFRAKYPEKAAEIQNAAKKAITAPKFSSAPRPPAKGNKAATSKSDEAKQSSAISMSMQQKKELAKRLAQALAAQGKKDISTENCEQLIEVYTLIDKKVQENETLNTAEKSLSECLKDCIKSGSLSSLKNLIQHKDPEPFDERPLMQFQQQQPQQFNDMASRVQSILMSLGQNQNFNSSSQETQQKQQAPPAPRNDYRNFPALANFDTSLNFNASLPITRQTFASNNNSNDRSNTGMYNAPTQNWVQGSVLNSGLSSLSNSRQSFPFNKPNNQMSSSSDDMNRSGNWQRPNFTSQMPQNRFGGSSGGNNMGYGGGNNNYNSPNAGFGGQSGSNIGYGGSSGYGEGGNSGYNGQSNYTRR